MYTFSYALILLAVIAFISGTIIALSVITKENEKLEDDRANTTRATLLLLIALVLAVLVLVYARSELAHSVKDMLM